MVRSPSLGAMTPYIFCIGVSMIIDVTLSESVVGCPLQIVVDKSLHSSLTQRFQGSGYGVSTRQQVYKLIQDHIDFANSILRKYTLMSDNRGSRKTIRLYSKDIKIMPDDCHGGDSVDDYLCNFPVSANSSVDFLARHSENNHNDFCLSFLLTNNEFFDGSLGSAYQAHPLRVDEGGVCSKFSPDPTSPTGGRSRNIGFVSFSNQGRPLPDQVTKLIFIHEIGHSLGSPHDFPSSCLRNELSNGHYIMHPKRGVQGFLDTNYQFSACTIKNISITLESLGRHGRNCFLSPPPASVCGNGVIEAWEECDCGKDYQDCAEDSCCHPGNHPTAPCTLKPRAQCSPSEGPCCTKDCKVISRHEEKVCREESECSYEGICDGTSARCLQSSHKPDSIPCENDSKMCQAGQCSVSACSRFNMVACSPGQSRPCEVHCQLRSRPKTCRPSSQLESLFSQGPVYHGQGSLCHILLEEDNPNTTKVDFGYCEDTYHTCQKAVFLNPYRGYQTPSVWVVGLVMALVAYLTVNAIGIYIYCRYFKYRAPPYQHHDSKTVVDDSQSEGQQFKAIEHETVK